MGRKRWIFQASSQAQVALDAVRELRTPSELADIHQVHPSEIASWKRQLTEGAVRGIHREKRKEC